MTMNKYDKAHMQNLVAIERQIEAIYQSAVRESARLGVSLGSINHDKVFSFTDYPITKGRVDKLLQGLKNRLYTCIVNGINASWTLSNNKNNELSRQVFGDNVGKLSQQQYRRYFSTNDEARKAFIQRKTNGLELSDRVWNYTTGFQREIELGLDVCIRNGMSAADMTKELGLFLKHPDKLFRRIRDEHGNLNPSKLASEFHPGRGVYRSSYMNARRLAATETNIAYRTSDYLRWQDMDFVVGIRVVMSNNHTCLGRDGKPHPFTDICDELSAPLDFDKNSKKGCYPKDFKFTGWHPHCRCHAISILKTAEEMAEDNKRIGRGEELQCDSVNKVTATSDEFNVWIKDNAIRIIKSNSIPYFIDENKNYVLQILQKSQPSTQMAKTMAHDYFYEYVGRYYGDMASERLDTLYKRLLNNEDKMNDIAKSMLVNQIKQEAVRLTMNDLIDSGVIGKDWVMERSEFNVELGSGKVFWVKGKKVKIPKDVIDVVVFKDKYGKEFAFPVGIDTANNPFKATLASEALSEFPPYLSKGIKRVSFFNRPCPWDAYWKVAYSNPKHISMATDGGETIFWINPKDKDEFKGYMAHEAGHILDTRSHKISSSVGWHEAVSKDDEIYKRVPTLNRVSEYAKTNDLEDFAECIKSYITNHDWFKKSFPNRAYYIRRLAQKLSGYSPRTP